MSAELVVIYARVEYFVGTNFWDTSSSHSHSMPVFISLQVRNDKHLHHIGLLRISDRFQMVHGEICLCFFIVVFCGPSDTLRRWYAIPSKYTVRQQFGWIRRFTNRSLSCLGQWPIRTMRFRFGARYSMRNAGGWRSSPTCFSSQLDIGIEPAVCLRLVIFIFCSIGVSTHRLSPRWWSWM